MDLDTAAGWCGPVLSQVNPVGVVRDSGNSGHCVNQVDEVCPARGGLSGTRSRWNKGDSRIKSISRSTSVGLKIPTMRSRALIRWWKQTLFVWSYADHFVLQ